MNKQYIIAVTVLTFIVPVAGSLTEYLTVHNPITFALFGKWFIFSAVGLRLFLAGIKQSSNPAFTEKEIFHMKSDESFPVVRELRSANLCFALVTDLLISLVLLLYFILMV